jgi:trans-aconitate methyltransferase
MYTDLASWWHLLSPPSDYAEEAASYAKALTEHVHGAIATVLELGCGGGNNASHLKQHWTLTLVDVSPGMLDNSRALNPECEHIEGDMRTVRLGRVFDAVLIHDAIMYMTTEQDLAGAIETAAVHLRAGGTALFVPDDTTESYRAETLSGGNDGDDRAIRYLQWNRRAHGTTALTTFVYVLDEGDRTRVEHEDHVTGLFPRATWLRLITDAGLDPVAVPYEHSEFRPDIKRDMFMGVKL